MSIRQVDDGHAPNHHWVNVSLFLGSQQTNTRAINSNGKAGHIHINLAGSGWDEPLVFKSSRFGIKLFGGMYHVASLLRLFIHLFIYKLIYLAHSTSSLTSRCGSGKNNTYRFNVV